MVDPVIEELPDGPALDRDRQSLLVIPEHDLELLGNLAACLTVQHLPAPFAVAIAKVH
jgi:hypothetical protein